MTDSSDSSSPSSPSYYDDYLDDHQKDLLNMYRLNRSIHDPWYTVFVITYVVVIAIAFVSNSLAIWSVFRRKEIWTPRNIFILKLALADLFLCVTMSFSATDVLTKYWPFGKNSLTLCRCVKASPCFVVYMASITIVIIAMDRYRCIVHPTTRQLSTTQALLILPFVVIVALIMSLPVYLHAHLHVPMVQAAAFEPQESSPVSESVYDSDYAEGEATDLDGIPWNDIAFCIEDWATKGNASTKSIQAQNKRHHYSIFSLLFQFVIPFTVISSLYLMIYLYLRKHRMVRKEKSGDREKARRTNTMLFRISMVFCICWLPLNILGLIIDATNLFKSNHELMLCAFITCHLIGMSSACINPMLYGYRYETVRHEQFKILTQMVAKCWKLKSSLLPKIKPSAQLELESVVVKCAENNNVSSPIHGIQIEAENASASLSHECYGRGRTASTDQTTTQGLPRHSFQRGTSVLVTRLSNSGSHASI